MLEALVVYLIVAAAAVWVLWSVMLPARLRRAIRRRLAGRSRAVAAPTETRGCDNAGCPGCGRYV